MYVNDLVLLFLYCVILMFLCYCVHALFFNDLVLLFLFEFEYYVVICVVPIAMTEVLDVKER